MLRSEMPPGISNAVQSNLFIALFANKADIDFMIVFAIPLLPYNPFAALHSITYSPSLPDSLLFWFFDMC